jgi:ubiquinone/menaquinone biosynthesis C-methylase UbiE
MRFRTIERLHLQPGARVLDVCCGSGASAIAAAQKVGSEGFVLGIDLAEKLLERARSKATKHGLLNVEFKVGDMLDLRVLRLEFDAVVCVFGIFFVPDMRAGVQALWEVVRPGGQGTAQDVVAFTSSDGKFRTGMHKAGPEHEEYKSA